MRDGFDQFLIAQRERITRRLETRCGDLDDIPDDTDLSSLVLEIRGNGCHASGKRKKSDDDQMGRVTRRGERQDRHERPREVVWQNLERKAGRLGPWKGTV